MVKTKITGEIREAYLDRVIEGLDVKSLEEIARESVEAGIKDTGDADLENLIMDLGWEDLFDGDVG